MVGNRGLTNDRQLVTVGDPTRRTPDSVVRTRLFPNCPAFVGRDPKSAGFGELHPSERLRGIEREAVCYVPVAHGVSFGEPCIMVRAIAPVGPRPSYLAVKVQGKDVGTHLIPGYGSYFFPLPHQLTTTKGTDAIEVSLSTLNSPGAAADGVQVSVYEVQLLDLERNDFDERHVFFEQAQIFEPSGGHLYTFLSGYPFDANARILDIGGGLGWTTVLLAGLGGARAWCIDTHDYTRPGGVNFKTELWDRFHRHRSALANIALLASLADSGSLNEAIDRCTFLTMNAEEMLLASNAFDFAF